MSESQKSIAESPAQPASQKDNHLGWEGTEHQLTKEQVVRYSRQIILPSFGARGLPQTSCIWDDRLATSRDRATLSLPGSSTGASCSPAMLWCYTYRRPGVKQCDMLCAAQSSLCTSSVLVIGAGGLGSPVAMYLAAAGVGRLGIADHDAVELNNLHRQIAHRESTVGVHKCDSAGLACRSINSSIQVTRFPALQPGRSCCAADPCGACISAASSPVLQACV